MPGRTPIADSMPSRRSCLAPAAPTSKATLLRESRISGTSLDDMRNNVAGIDFAYRTIFADALETADARLADTVASRIEQLKTIVSAPNLPHVDIRALRRASEELVVALQAASAK